MHTAPTLPPNPSLLAVLLVIRTRSGPRFVFHYPPNPAPTTPKSAWHLDSHKPGGNGSDDTSTASSDDDTATVASDDGSSTRHNVLSAGSPRAAKGTLGTPRSHAFRRTARTLREEGPEDEEEEGDVPELSLNGGGAGTGEGGGGGGGGGRERSGSEAGKNEGGRSRGSRGSGGGGGGAGGASTEGLAAEWEAVLGYSTEGLEKLLSPSPEAGKKRFEVLIEDMVFLGYPVFVRENGAWGKKRKKKESKGHEGMNEDGKHGSQESGPLKAEEPAMLPHLTGLDIPRAREASSQHGNHAVDGYEASTSYQSQSALSEAASEAKSASSSGISAEEMSMFHVVFILNPPALEHHVRVEEMYNNVAKKFSKALKYEQARSGYVWHEARRILSMKAQAKENRILQSITWASIMQASPLAKSLAQIYTSISSSQIAHIPISKNVDASLQIPQAISTPYVPTPTEPQMPGIWLTTASMIDDDEADTALSPHAALLLLEDKETLLKEVEDDNRELAAPLAYFIRELTPTKSLQKLAARLSLRLPDIQFLARHLIYWRRARAVPPLHIRDTYIVSPNADMGALSAAMGVYDRKFPGLPSLPRMLQSLSARPVQYGHLIPSHDHKEAYVEILGWLLRGGWITQLRTFAWVKVTAEVKAAVAAQARRDDERAAKRVARKRESTISEGSSSSRVRRAMSDEEGGSQAGKSRTNSMNSPRFPGRSPLSRPQSDAESVSSGRTAVPASLAVTSSPALRPSPLSAVNTLDSSPFGPGSSIDDTASVVPPLDLAGHEPSLVLSPHKATTLESRWLKYVGETLADEELRESWPTLYRYFDGRSAMEDIAAREVMKRSKVAGLVSRLEREGVLCVVRHW